jgi:2-enoate reductase
MDIADGAANCALNPVTLNEKKYRIEEAGKKKNIAVIGGGIGGMEAARLLTLRGHKVTIYEKTAGSKASLSQAPPPPSRKRTKSF